MGKTTILCSLTRVQGDQNVLAWIISKVKDEMQLRTYPQSQHRCSVDVHKAWPLVFLRLSLSCLCLWSLFFLLLKSRICSRTLWLSSFKAVCGRDTAYDLLREKMLPLPCLRANFARTRSSWSPSCVVSFFVPFVLTFVTGFSTVSSRLGCFGSAFLFGAMLRLSFGSRQAMRPQEICDK